MIVPKPVIPLESVPPIKIRKVLTTGIPGVARGALKACRLHDIPYSGYTVAQKYRHRNEIDDSALTSISNTKGENASLREAEKKNIEAADVVLVIQSLYSYSNADSWKRYQHVVDSFNKIKLECVEPSIEFNRKSVYNISYHYTMFNILHRYGQARYDALLKTGVVLTVVGDHDSPSLERYTKYIFLHLATLR